MSRNTRNTVIQSKLEVTYGVNPGSFGATEAALISNPKFKIDRDVVPRELVRGYLGGSEHLIGARRAMIDFDLELAGSGAAGTPPPYGIYLRGCGMAETISAASHVEYTPVSGAFESLTMRYMLDGIKHVARGCRGTVKFKLNAYGIPMMNFNFMGFDTTASEQSLASDFSAWQRPLVVTDANAGDIRLGGSYTGAGGITGGTVLASRGLEIDLGNKVSHLKMLGGESIDIVDRDTTGKMSVELTAAEEVAWRDLINANTLTTLGFNFGTVAGQKITVFAPNMQRIDPQSEDYEGVALTGSELRLLPLNGNDELTVTVR